jgi:aminoglycoside phosphotransferase (APT) family kinase protein
VSLAPVSADRLRAWAGEVVGGEVLEWRRLTSGNSRSTFAVDVRVGADLLELVVRHDEGGGPVAGTELSLEREAAVYGALADSGLPVPRLHGRSDVLRAIAVTRLPGAAVEAGGVLGDLLARLAELHRLPATELELPGFAPTAAGDLDLWQAIARQKLSEPSELVDFAFELLRDTFPGEPERIVMCHGDYGEGNFLVQEGRVSALLDWEFAHLGDPYDDLAWITVRALMFGHDLPDFAAQVRDHYLSATGLPLIPSRCLYWQTVVVLRNLICCLAVAYAAHERDRTIHLMLLPGLAHRLVRLLAELYGVPLEPSEALSANADLPGDLLLREVVAGLRELTAAIPEAEPRRRARRLGRMLGQFAETWTLAAAVAAANAEDRAAAGPGRAARLALLGRITERELALLPQASPIAGGALAGLEESS